MHCTSYKTCHKRGPGIGGVFSCMMCRLAADRAAAQESTAAMARRQEAMRRHGEERLRRFLADVHADQQRANAHNDRQFQQAGAARHSMAAQKTLGH